MLDVQQHSIAIGIELETKAPNIETSLIEPDHRRGEFLREIRRGQNHSDILREVFLIGLTPFEELKQIAFRIIVTPDLLEVGTIDSYGLVEGHGRHHRRVSQRLKPHVSTGLRPLQLDHDQVSLPIDCKQVHPPSGFVPIAKLLADDQEVWVKNLDLFPDQAL